jgi:hypothetical protein
MEFLTKLFSKKQPAAPSNDPLSRSKKTLALNLLQLRSIQVGIVRTSVEDGFARELLAALTERWNPQLAQKLYSDSADSDHIRFAVALGDSLAAVFTTLKERLECEFPTSNLILQHGAIDIYRRRTNRMESFEVVLAIYYDAPEQRKAVIVAAGPDLTVVTT